MGDFVPLQQFCNWQHNPDAKQQQGQLKCCVKNLTLPQITKMDFALFTIYAQRLTNKGKHQDLHAARRESQSMHTLQQVPPRADTATHCNVTSCTSTRSDLKQSAATSSQLCTWTNKLCLSAQKIRLALSLPKQLPCFWFQNWLVLLCTILCYALAVEISWPVHSIAPKWYKQYCREQSSSTLVLFIQNIDILGHVGCWHNPSPLLSVSHTMADHTSFTPLYGLEHKKNWKWTCCANWSWHLSYWESSACTLFLQERI